MLHRRASCHAAIHDLGFFTRSGVVVIKHETHRYLEICSGIAVAHPELTRTLVGSVECGTGRHWLRIEVIIGAAIERQPSYAASVYALNCQVRDPASSTCAGI